VTWNTREFVTKEYRRRQRSISQPTPILVSKRRGKKGACRIFLVRKGSTRNRRGEKIDDDRESDRIGVDRREGSFWYGVVVRKNSTGEGTPSLS